MTAGYPSEPVCTHTGIPQPMSRCEVCRDTAVFTRWQQEWNRWLEGREGCRVTL